MPVARPIVETVASDSPEYIDFFHNSGVTSQLEVRLDKESLRNQQTCCKVRHLWRVSQFI